MTLSRQIVNMGISFVLILIIARILGPEGQGMYSLVILLPNLLVTFLNLGIGVSGVYFIGKQKYSTEEIIKTNVTLAKWLSLFSIIIGITIITFFSEVFFEGIGNSQLYLILSIIPLMFINQFLQTVFQGKQDFKAFNSILLFGEIINLVFVIILVWILSIGLTGAIIAFATGHITRSLLIIYLVKSVYNYRLSNVKMSFSYLKESLKFGLKTHMSNILAFINYRVDLLIISYFLGPAAVGIYVISVNVVERLWVVPKSVSTVLLPKISNTSSIGKKNLVTSTVSRIILFVSVLMALVMYLISDIAINILFGESYEQSSILLKILLVGIISGAPAKIIANDFAGRGKPELNLYISIFTVLSNILLNILLIPTYGLIGAAVATSITYSINWLVKIVIFNRISKLPLKELLLLKKSDIFLLINFLKRVRKVK
ncbi:flippase [Aquisalibacillus elongatus]|nr:flippase [Aquisalibacillus elongatus]